MRHHLFRKLLLPSFLYIVSSVLLHGVSASLPVPYTQPANPSSLFGDPTRGPEPSPMHVTYPLPAYDEEWVQETVNQGNPFEDYGHFRLKLDVTFTPWVMKMGPESSEVSELQLQNMLGQFERPRDVGDGSLMRYTVLRPPEDAAMPEGGWPLVVINPGVGSIGQQGLSEVLGDTSQWASPYHREHYPAYVLRWHPQARVTTPLDGGRTQAEPAYYAAMEFLDRFIEEEPIDRNRIYVMGFSMGGRTTWRNLMDRPDFFAAAVPHSGGGPFPGGSSKATRITQIPIWMMIGNQDPWSGSARYIQVYQDLVSAGAERIRFWEQQDVGHHDDTLRSFHIPEWFWSFSLEDDFRAAAPRVLEAPEDLTVVEGQPVELKALFMGAPAPEVEWRKGSEVLGGVSGTYWAKERVRLEDAGSYVARASNAHGEMETEGMELTVVPDTDGPVLVAVGTGGPETLVVEFDEPVAAGTGSGGSENADHYALSPDGNVVGAKLQTDEATVLLTVSGLEEGQRYHLAVEQVEDRAAEANPVAGQRMGFVFRPSLVGHWPMDAASGTEVADQSGQGNAGLLLSRGNWVAGRIDGGLQFTGDDDYLDVPMNAFDATAGTLSLWAKRVGEGSDRRQSIVSKRSNTEAASRLGIRMTQSTGSLTFSLGDQSSIFVGETLEEAWAHLVISWGDGQYAIYVNGESVASGEYGELAHGGEAMQVGNTLTGGQGFAGLVDDLRLYNRILSGEELRELYIAGITPPEPRIRQTRILPDGQMEILVEGQTGVVYQLEHKAGLAAATEWMPQAEAVTLEEAGELRFAIDPEVISGFFRITGQYVDEEVE